MASEKITNIFSSNRINSLRSHYLVTRNLLPSLLLMLLMDNIRIDIILHHDFIWNTPNSLQDTEHEIVLSIFKGHSL